MIFCFQAPASVNSRPPNLQGPPPRTPNPNMGPRNRWVAQHFPTNKPPPYNAQHQPVTNMSTPNSIVAQQLQSGRNMARPPNNNIPPPSNSPSTGTFLIDLTDEDDVAKKPSQATARKQKGKTEGVSRRPVLDTHAPPPPVYQNISDGSQNGNIPQRQNNNKSIKNGNIVGSHQHNMADPLPKGSIASPAATTRSLPPSVYAPPVSVFNSLFYNLDFCVHFKK